MYPRYISSKSNTISNTILRKSTDLDAKVQSKIWDGSLVFNGICSNNRSYCAMGI